jgi:hypothetical protein
MSAASLAQPAESAQPVKESRTAIPAQPPGDGRPGRLAQPSSRPSSRPGQRPLRVVRPRRHAARAPFVVLVSLVLGSGLVFLLLVNTWLAAGSFTVHSLQASQSSLADQQQALAQTIASESTPQQLARRAAALGMVPAPNPVFRAPTGAVLGVQTVAQAPPKPAPSPTASPSVSPSASPSATPSGSAKPSTSPSPSASAGAEATGPAAAGATKPSTSAGAKAGPTPSAKAGVSPSAKAGVSPSAKPGATPSAKASVAPSAKPSVKPSVKPSTKPAAKASGQPTGTVAPAVPKAKP